MLINLIKELSYPTGDLFTGDLFQMALGAVIRIVVNPRCWLPGSRPQHLVPPDRGEAVDLMAPIFVLGRPLHPDVDRLSNTSFKPSQFYC